MLSSWLMLFKDIPFINIIRGSFDEIKFRKVGRGATGRLSKFVSKMRKKRGVFNNGVHGIQTLKFRGKFNNANFASRRKVDKKETCVSRKPYNQQFYF